ncbi:MAG: rimI [Microbacteriaceae bacterium]|jgi:ribosomal-protein-alanine N-acetyltransferase|nr:rimI [Microbacteriaceae bacterium]HEV7955960.1 ribosomal protein S18-alanine N-acetyltransferase [Marisediminicola sp.]
MSWQLRRATAGDLDAIMHLETSVFANDAWSRESMRGELSNPQCHYLVAFRPQTPEAVEGYAGLFAPKGTHQGDVQTIAVAESSRRAGLGRLLVQTLLVEAHDRGAREVFLEVRADNPGAQSLYESLGFKEIAVRVAYYQPDGMDAVVMRLVIEQPKAAPA